MLFFEFQEKLESNRPEKFESNGPFEQIDLWNRPIGLFICKEIAISAKEPNWALLMLKNGRISGYFVLLHILENATAKKYNLEVRDNFNSVFRANGVRSAGPKIKNKVENLPVQTPVWNGSDRPRPLTDRILNPRLILIREIRALVASLLSPFIYEIACIQRPSDHAA